MADFVFNVALGRVAEFYDRVDQSDPTNAVLVIVAIDTSESDATLKDLDTLSAVLANGNTAEVTNTNYARIVLDDTDLSALAADDSNDRMDLDIPDQVFSNIAAGDGWTDLLICYDPDSTGGTDADIIPLTQHDFVVTPDGNDINVNVDAAGFYRAS
jgi:hypothetical protein